MKVTVRGAVPEVGDAESDTDREADVVGTDELGVDEEDGGDEEGGEEDGGVIIPILTSMSYRGSGGAGHSSGGSVILNIVNDGRTVIVLGTELDIKP